MNENILKKLLEQKGFPCVTLIVSMEMKSFTHKEKFNLKFKNALKKVQKELNSKCEQETVVNILNSLKSLVKQVKLHQDYKGIGLFSSPNYSRLVNFMIPVQDKLVVDDGFNVRDVIDNLNHLKAYHLLFVNKGETRLYKGSGVFLHEIVNDDFPLKYVEQYQVQRAGPGTFYYDEESKVNLARIEGYFRKVDTCLPKSLEADLLVVMGTDKLLSLFTSISKHKSSIVGEINGNYEALNVQELSNLVWPVIEKRLKKNEESIVQKAQDALFNRKAVSGIQEVWNIAQRGTGFQLVVERDFICKAYLQKENYQIVLNKELDGELEEIPDTVDKIIEVLLEKNGVEVHIVENDLLKDFGRIILTTEY